MESVTLKYTSGGSNYSQAFNVLKVYGAYEPDRVEFFPPQQNEYRDGSIDEQMQGFRRIITIDMGVVSAHNDRGFVLYFLLAPIKSIVVSTGEEIPVVVYTPDGFEVNWLEGLFFATDFVLQLKERTVRTSFPGVIVNPVTQNELMIKTGVNVPGTYQSPTPFTTNLGVLATDDTGQPFPPINLALWSVSIQLTSKQEATVFVVGPITQSGSNITFNLAHHTQGNDADGAGNYYADISIQLQHK